MIGQSVQEDGPWSLSEGCAQRRCSFQTRTSGNMRGQGFCARGGASSGKKEPERLVRGAGELPQSAGLSESTVLSTASHGGCTMSPEYEEGHGAADGPGAPLCRYCRTPRQKGRMQGRTTRMMVGPHTTTALSRFQNSRQDAGSLRNCSATRYAAGRYVIAVPVVDGQRLDAHAGPGLGTMHEVVLADVDAGVIARARNPEHHDIAGAETAARNTLTDARLVSTDTGNSNAVSGTGPVDETGAVESFGRGGAAGNVGTAELAFGRGRNGRTAAGSHAALLRIGRAVGLFAAACHHQKGREQNQQQKAAMQSMSARCRHGDPAVVLNVQYFLCRS